MLQSGPLLPGLVVSGKLYAVTLAINIVVGVTRRPVACAQQADFGGVRAVHLYFVRDTDDFAGAVRVGDVRLRVRLARAGVGADLDLPDPDRGDRRRAQHSAPASRRGGDFRLERATALARRDRALCHALRDERASSSRSRCRWSARWSPNSSSIPTAWPRCCCKAPPSSTPAGCSPSRSSSAAIAVVLVGVGELIERYLVRWRHTAVG